MAAHIEFQNPEFNNKELNHLRERYEGPKPTLKDQIYSGAILKDMYHKPKPVGPNADNLPDYDNHRF